MNQNKPNITQILRERGVRYVVDAEQRPTEVLISLQDYEHYLDLLAAEAAIQAQSYRRASPTTVTPAQLGGRGQDEHSAEELVAELAETTQLADEDITNQLNRIYEATPSTLEPELLQMQRASIDKAP